MTEISFVILAGGQGVRMGSALPKPLQLLGSKTMLERVVEAGRKLCPDTIIVVVRDEKVERKARELQCETVWQNEPLGTADALKYALLKCKVYLGIMVTCVDVPLVPYLVLKKLWRKHSEEKNYITILTTDLPDACGYGRVIKEGEKVIKIVEEKEAAEEEKKVTLINNGIYCIRRGNLEEYLNEIEKSPVKREYYLTDLVEIVNDKGLKVGELNCHYKYVLGVNTPEQLSQVKKILNAEEGN